MTLVRKFTEAEQATYDGLDKTVDQLAKDERAAEESQVREFGVTVGQTPIKPGVQESAGTEYRDADDRPVYITRPEERLPGARPDISVGRLVRAMVDGRYGKDLTREERDLSAAGIGHHGGLLLPSPVSANVLASARDATIVARGATWVQMPAGKLSFAGVDSDPTASFVGETQVLTEGAISFRGIDLDAKKVGTYLRITKKLARSSNAVPLIEDALKYAVGRAIDYAALYGAGAVGINGLANEASLVSTDQGSAAVTMDAIATLYGTLIAANPPSMSYQMLMASRLQSSIWKMKDGEGQPIIQANGGSAPAWWGYLSPKVTNLIPVTANLSDLWLIPTGPNGLVVGYLAEAEILASEVASNGSSHAFTSDEIWIRCVAYLDIASTRPAWCGRLYNVLV